MIGFTFYWPTLWLNRVMPITKNVISEISADVIFCDD